MKCLKDIVYCPRCGSKKTKRLRYVFTCNVCGATWNYQKNKVNIIEKE